MNQAASNATRRVHELRLLRQNIQPRVGRRFE